MYNETTYHSRDNKTSRKRQTKATAPPIGRVFQLDAENKRRLGNSKGQKKIGTSKFADGFLNCSFLPKSVVENQNTATDTHKKERDFYHFLSLLGEFYHIKPMETRYLGYPYNMTLAYWDVCRKLQQSRPEHIGMEIIQNDSDTVCISATETCTTGPTFYFIPIIPLNNLEKERKKTAQLIYSVYAYLYHIVNIPYYCKEDSYLYWQYEMHKDWIESEDDEDNENREYQLLQFKDAEEIGDLVEHKLWEKCHLSEFAERTVHFLPKDDFDKNCLDIAKEALQLYQTYPDASIFRNSKMECDEESDEEYITMDKYISFVADADGWLYDTIAESINNEFNECGFLEEPSIKRIFTIEELKKDDNLDFELRIFRLMNKLCYRMNHLPSPKT